MDVIVNKKTFKTEVSKSKSKILIYFHHRVELTVTICCATFLSKYSIQARICRPFDPKNPRKTEGPCTHSKGKANNLRGSKDCN